MSTKRKLSKEKSFYTLKKVHDKNIKGTIFENDYMTFIQNDDAFDGIPLYPNSNFKIKIDSNNNSKKRHVKNTWVMNGDSNVWTKSSLSGNTNINEDSKIILKPDYKSLNDFAYFGSAVELIQATVNDIIKRFPGGLCYYDEAPEIKIENKTYYLISNECQIDCWSKNVESVSNNQNPMRILSYSYKDYEDANGNSINNIAINISGNCWNSIIGNITINSDKFFIFKDNNGVNQLLTDKKVEKGGVIIQPKAKYFTDFWNSLDDFERVLLNKNSIPLYTAVFNKTYFDETGYYYTPQAYTWPTIPNTNFLDLSTFRYKDYINSLIDLASFHDEYDSDNIWRMMTHESIKNLDNTFKITEDKDLDFGRMQALTHIQGRLFDDIKRYVDGIKSINSISYNEQSNIPDYFLSDVVENKGWNAKNICTGNETTINDVELEVDGSTIILNSKGKTAGFVNSTFLRYLALNSEYLNSLKGTKNGIETMLALFGFDLYSDTPEVEITEYYAQVKDLLDYDDFVCKRAKFDYVNEGENTNFLRNYPLAYYDYDDKNTSPKIGPWYDPNEIYDNFYYQCKGGWGKINVKKINRPDITEIKTISGDTIYTETEPYMLFADNLNELKNIYGNRLREGVICYVSDISNIENEYTSGYTERNEKSVYSSGKYNFSHYFILENTDLSTNLGYVNNDANKCYGWYNIKLTEYNGESYPITDYGKKVLYLESLISNSTGNNPHIGRGEYDFGYDYLDKYHHLFREAIRDGLCDDLKEEYKEIDEFGFDITVSSSTVGKLFSCLTAEEIDSSIKRINLKNLSIRFKDIKNEEDKEYIMNIIIPYIEMMIPSTMIVEYLFGDEMSYMKKIEEKLAK